jgi:hypothetical protein
VDQLAEENGWELPELSESATLPVPGPKIEGHLEADVEGNRNIYPLMNLKPTD